MVNQPDMKHNDKGGENSTGFERYENQPDIIEKDKEKDTERGKEKDLARDKERDKEKDKEKDNEKDKNKDKDKEKEKEKDKDVDKDVDKGKEEFRNQKFRNQKFQNQKYQNQGLQNQELQNHELPNQELHKIKGSIIKGKEIVEQNLFNPALKMFKEKFLSKDSDKNLDHAEAIKNENQHITEQNIIEHTKFIEKIKNEQREEKKIVYPEEMLQKDKEKRKSAYQHSGEGKYQYGITNEKKCGLRHSDEISQEIQHRDDSLHFDKAVKEVTPKYESIYDELIYCQADYAFLLEVSYLAINNGNLERCEDLITDWKEALSVHSNNTYYLYKQFQQVMGEQFDTSQVDGYRLKQWMNYLESDFIIRYQKDIVKITDEVKAMFSNARDLKENDIAFVKMRPWFCNGKDGKKILILKGMLDLKTIHQDTDGSDKE